MGVTVFATGSGGVMINVVVCKWERQQPINALYLMEILQD